MVEFHCRWLSSYMFVVIYSHDSILASFLDHRLLVHVGEVNFRPQCLIFMIFSLLIVDKHCNDKIIVRILNSQSYILP